MTIMALDGKHQVLGRWTYHGVEIQLTQHGSFSVHFAADSSDQPHVDTLQAAKDLIDGRARKKLKAKKLDLKVVTHDGKLRTVTGIHVGHGAIIVKGPDGKVTGGRWSGRQEYYVDAPAVRDLVRQHLAAEKREHEIREQLELFHITHHYRSKGYGSALSDEEYAAAVEEAERDYAEKYATALEMGNAED